MLRVFLVNRGLNLVQNPLRLAGAAAAGISGTYPGSKPDLWIGQFGDIMDCLVERLQTSG